MLATIKWPLLTKLLQTGNQVYALDRTQLVSHESGLSNFTNSKVYAAHDRDRMLMGKTEKQPVFQRRLQLLAALLESGGLRPNSREFGDRSEEALAIVQEFIMNLT